MDFQFLFKDSLLVRPIILWIFESDKFEGWGGSYDSIEKSFPLFWGSLDEAFPLTSKKIKASLTNTNFIHVSRVVTTQLWFSFSRVKYSDKAQVSFSGNAMTFVLDKDFDLTAKIPR